MLLLIPFVVFLYLGIINKMKDQLSFNQKYYKMIKGYWNGQVLEIRNEEKWNNHLENNSGNFIPIFAG